MGYRFLRGKAKVSGFSCGLRRGFNYKQSFSLEISYHISRVSCFGTRVPCFELTSGALSLYNEELCTIDQLKWDLGLPYVYGGNLVPHYTDIFSLACLPDDRIGLKLLAWDDTLALSQLEKNAVMQSEQDLKNKCLAFRIGFTRGFGLRNRCMEWLKEWQKLPYTSPYADASHLDPRTDVSEKRIVGVFHELLHLTIKKKTECQNVSNLHKPLSLPQKFTKVFEQHPDIFYISKKGDTQTIVLREAYNCQQLIQRHPFVDIRERYVSIMRKGFLNRSKGLYKKTADVGLENSLKIVHGHKMEMVLILK
ncbi:hypothetical protein DITRI_Ditri15bG0037400 [Diplodiscus trichospermus]